MEVDPATPATAPAPSAADNKNEELKKELLKIPEEGRVLITAKLESLMNVIAEERTTKEAMKKQLDQSATEKANYEAQIAELKKGFGVDRNITQKRVSEFLKFIPEEERELYGLKDIGDEIQKGDINSILQSYGQFACCASANFLRMQQGRSGDASAKRLAAVLNTDVGPTAVKAPAPQPPVGQSLYERLDSVLDARFNLTR